MSRFLGAWTPADPEWHEARRWRIGGSEIGTVCGWNQYETADELLARKLGTLEPRPGSDAMRRGNHMEAAIRSWLTAEKGVVLREELRGTYVHDGHDFALANPDDIDDVGDVWEYKAPAVRDIHHGWGRAGSGAIPLMYQAQAVWNAGVVGAPRTMVCVWAGAPKFYPAIYRVEFDPTVFAYLIRRGAEFAEQLNQTRKTAA